MLPVYWALGLAENQGAETCRTTLFVQNILTFFMALCSQLMVLEVGDNNISMVKLVGGFNSESHGVEPGWNSRLISSPDRNETHVETTVVPTICPLNWLFQHYVWDRKTSNKHRQHRMASFVSN